MASAPDLPWSASRTASPNSVIASVAMRCCRSPMLSTCLYREGAVTPSLSARAARLTASKPASSAKSAPAVTTSVVFRPALGMSVLGQERQDGIGDLLRVLGVGVVARVLDHHVTAQFGR